MQKHFLGMWKNPQGVAVTDIGSKKMLFSFKDRRRGLQIMQNGPWNVRRNMVKLRLWREGESVYEVDHDFMEFWIQIHGIPHDFMDKETGILIGKMLGVLAEVEDPKMDGVLRRPYLRIRVSIDITKALPTGFWLDREELPPLWVFFRYERLPDSYCFNCGILGHEKKKCKYPTAMACWDTTKRKYSPGLGVGQGRPVSTVGGGNSRQQGWNEDGEEGAREQRNTDRESEEKKNFEESRIRDEQAQQRKIREESVWENQTRREEEMAEPEEQVEKVPKISDFQGIRETEPELGVAYKLKNLIEEIRERKNKWANKNKAQKGKQIIEIQGSREMGPTKEIGAKEGVNPVQARMGMGIRLKQYYTIEEGEVNSYRTAEWTLGLEKEGGKETIGQELRRLMLAKNKDIQAHDGRVQGKKIQILSKCEMEGDILKKPIEETQKENNEVRGQHMFQGESFYYVELTSDEDQEVGKEAHADWETQLAKKLEKKLNLKRKREFIQVPLLTQKEWKEEHDDKKIKKLKNNRAVLNGIFVYGNPVFQKRRKLWQELTISNMNKKEPQAYMGDFNDILSQDEKVGVHPQPKNCLETFRKFVDDNGLMDVDLKGSRYTWFSNPRNNFVTRERLDRVLVNWKWLQMYQNVILKATPAISSDHCALILETQPR
ncbi:hypothetical protein Ahy_A07g030984 [Arachis hypogaea]|uniref:CCHC-type domain-containing protein n=1 Tax=Arachis hypogaea TaxID=3818 RepID=A0A445C2I3_ARAHY|nr:hypothetical protein Ahy_A07g030984 [Arachis hypogaea]